MIPRVIPTLLLDGNGLVKTVKFRNPTYIGDPINAVRLYNDMEVDELAFLDINVSKENTIINIKILKDIASECFMPLAYGGGINNLEDVKKIIQVGFEKVIINTAAVLTPQLITEASRLFGAQSIVGSIDVKKNLWGRNRVCIKGGTKITDINPIEHAVNLEKLGCGEILLTSIDKEGKMEGYDIELIHSVSSKVEVPVIASGGAGKLSDFHEAVVNGDASAVASGSMFVYQSRTKGILINYPPQKELIKIFENE
jgi:imidazole glycerol-phosphate synthase subunit HisF